MNDKELEVLESLDEKRLHEAEDRLDWRENQQTDIWPWIALTIAGAILGATVYCGGFWDG